MSDLHLISHYLCPYVQRAVIVLNEKGIEHKKTYIDLANKPDWFLELSPLGRVPVLQTEGRVLFESQVIAEYLDEVTEGSLHPSSPLEKARHRSWIEFGSDTLVAIATFYSAKDEASFETAKQNLREKFERIEGEIAGPFFDGEEFHLIDGVWATIFRYFDAIDRLKKFDILSDLEKVTAWKEHVLNRQSVKTAVPDDYYERLEVFLKNRGSYLSGLLG